MGVTAFCVVLTDWLTAAELLLDDEGSFGANSGGTVVSGSRPCGAKISITAAAGSACAPPVLCAIPVRGSPVAVDPIDVVPVVLVVPVDTVELDAAEGEPGEGVVADIGEAIDAAVGSVAGVVSAAGVVPVDGVDGNSVLDDPESIGSANAIPGVLATAAPTPKATANAPTRPTYVA
jgi:hypothetical protein